MWCLKLTICMTVVPRSRDAIIAGCDTRVVLWKNDHHEVFRCRKFAISRKRNILFLISGMWYGARQNPRIILEKDVEKLISGEDTVHDVAKKTYEYLLPLYPKVNGRGWQLQVCGFDSNLAKVYVLLSNPPPHRADIEEVQNGAITGTEGIFAFTKEYGVPPLGSMNLSEDEIKKAMKEYMKFAVKFENEWSVRENRPPMTDNRINVLVVHPNSIEWKEPKHYYPKDEKKLEKLTKQLFN